MQTTEEKYALALKGVDRFWKWAEKEDLPKELVYDLISEGDDPEPPFHKVLTWFDLFTPDGVKVHGTARGNVTAEELGRVLKVTAEVTSKLMENGWSSADGERTTRVQQDGVDGTRKIGVESIRKSLTDSGKVCYNVKGHPWTKYGVTAWPDSSNIDRIVAMVDLETWETGAEISFGTGELFAVVELKDGDKPRKVIGWSGPRLRKPDDEDFTLDDVDEIPF